ncbi:methionyl-tRNA formyltransferase [Mesonia sp. K7]|uniref:methionyl-tRNA formyltransferase n=1 Tax=Mesonia sp. K7 TaxID=2218606 RepID=UPI000DA8C435|nr:formyltransferase family protein [Mesonia sp. K7]PZD76621.1 hypothetical protein DNG35_11565 [Mesonia sp. K7]
MKYAFAGDRQIGCNILKYLIEQGYEPSALLVSRGKNESHAETLRQISNLPEEYIFSGNSFKEKENIQKLNDLSIDYIIGIHFPYIIPTEVLSIPKIGFLNLHPAYLPYNKGWHTPSWAILEGTPYGATLHFMSEDLDEGDIIHQKELQVDTDDTANSLYQKVLTLEEEVFKEALEDLVSLKPKKSKQTHAGTSHIKKDLEKVKELKLEEKYTAREILDKIRALTTNKDSELAFFVEDGKKVGVRVEFILLEEN